jgi:hypothetical protein
MLTKRLTKRPLVIEEILAWAIAFREATGKLPTRTSGGIVCPMQETWAAVDSALREGARGLPGGSSLAQLFAEKLGARTLKNRPRLTIETIMRWLDEHHQQKEEWPTLKSGRIPNSGGEDWRAIDQALRKGQRGLPGGSSLARLLAEHRGQRNRKQLQSYTEEQILEWLDAYFQEKGTWPTSRSGPIPGATGETWMAVQMALSHGLRGLPGGSSIAALLAANRGVRKTGSLPDLAIPEILVWCDEWHKTHGDWPHINSGEIPGTNGETWSGINRALLRGSRGLPGGMTLAELLARERGVRSAGSLPKLYQKGILPWMDAHRRRKGEWPTIASGPIPEAPGETWCGVDTALRDGIRGLRGGSSLARLLAKYRGRKHCHEQPPLSYKKIVRWADGHKEKKGQLPNVNSGPVLDVPGERWDLIDNALRNGHRGLRGGSSLLKLLAKKRGLRNPLSLPPLTEPQIVMWATLKAERTGSRPVDYALRHGKRGLGGGSSLAKLLDKYGVE